MQNCLNSSKRLKAISCCSGDFGRTVIPIDRQKSEQSRQRKWGMWRPNVSFHHRMTSLCPSDKVLKYLSFVLRGVAFLLLSCSSYEPSCLKNPLIIGVILKMIVDARGVEPLSRIPSPIVSTRLDPYVNHSRADRSPPPPPSLRRWVPFLGAPFVSPGRGGVYRSVASSGGCERRGCRSEQFADEVDNLVAS